MRSSLIRTGTRPAVFLRRTPENGKEDPVQIIRTPKSGEPGRFRNRETGMGQNLSRALNPEFPQVLRETLPVTPAQNLTHAGDTQMQRRCKILWPHEAAFCLYFLSLPPMI